MTGTESHDREATDFASRATETRPGLFVELWEFLRHNKKWWLTPIILVLLLIGALILLAGTAAAPRTPRGRSRGPIAPRLRSSGSKNPLRCVDRSAHDAATDHGSRSLASPWREESVDEHRSLIPTVTYAARHAPP